MLRARRAILECRARRPRILAYGDSLTAGYCDGPARPSGRGRRCCSICSEAAQRWIISGCWTTAEMLRVVDDPREGLRGKLTSAAQVGQPHERPRPADTCVVDCPKPGEPAQRGPPAGREFCGHEHPREPCREPGQEAKALIARLDEKAETSTTKKQERATKNREQRQADKALQAKRAKLEEDRQETKQKQQETSSKRVVTKTARQATSNTADRVECNRTEYLARKSGQHRCVLKATGYDALSQDPLSQETNLLHSPDSVLLQTSVHVYPIGVSRLPFPICAELSSARRLEPATGLLAVTRGTGGLRFDRPVAPNAPEPLPGLRERERPERDSWTPEGFARGAAWFSSGFFDGRHL
eukprot:7205457-Prymnesium_polylepis.1